MQTPSNDAERFLKIILKGQINMPFCHYLPRYYPPPLEVVFSLHHGITAAAKSLQSRPTLCHPIDGSPPGSAVPGILQGRTLEWGAMSFSVMVSQACTNIYTPATQPEEYPPTLLLGVRSREANVACSVS